MNAQHSDGFALAAVVVAVAVVGFLVSAGYFASVEARRLGRATVQGQHALYAAESGLADAIARWEESWSALPPGGDASTPPRELPNGDRFVLRVERTDDASAPALRTYLIHSYGRARGSPEAARHLALAVALRTPVGSDSGAEPPGADSPIPRPLPGRPWAELFR